MPRRLKLDTAELGRIELFLIYDVGGTWEATWRPAQDVPALEAATRVSKTMMDHALHGWTKPLVDALGPPPEGCLRKLPVISRDCAIRKDCPSFDKVACKPTAKKMPWCYEPDGLEGEARRLVSEAIALWREGVYVCLVREDP
jgi:hypothetical protein